jgi:predicted outer membrane repeat protein
VYAGRWLYFQNFNLHKNPAMKIHNAVLIFLLIFTCSRLHADIVYVDASATGAGNGSSWSDAFTDLQNGIAATIPGDTVWVAQGVYKPTATTTRSISFLLPDGVKIFGGFNGTEMQLSQRNFSLYSTVLSGDIGVTGNASDNTYNVVKTTTVSAATELDGFRIISGNGTGGPGGGLLNASGSPVIANCIFEFNRADNGAAVSQFNGGAMMLRQCIFRNNTANDNGGAIEVRAGNVTITGCEMYSNTAGLDGGALSLYGGITKIDRSIISGNSAAFIGGAVHGYYFSTLTITNSLIAGNKAADASAIYFPPTSNSNPHLLLNCTIADNAGASAGIAACVCLNSNSEISNCIFYGNYDPVEIYLLTGEVNYSIVEGGFTGAGANQVMNADPDFVSQGNYLLAPFVASGYDYHTELLSPARDAGSNSYLIPIYNSDLDQNARVHGPAVDLGCYENTYCTFDLSIHSSASDSICTGSVTVLSASAGTSFLWSDASVTSSIPVSAAGWYSLLADSAGCLGHDSIQITLLPASVAVSGPSTLCAGDSIALTATGANLATYLWNTADTVAAIFVSAPGTYSVTVTTTDGCTASDALVVNAAPAPNAVVSYSGGTLSTTQFSTYQWLLNNTIIPGASDSDYVPAQNGNYSVIVTNSSGCSDTSAVYIVTDVSVYESASSVFAAYPNPCTGTLHLQFTDGAEVIAVRLCDLRGQEVYCGTPAGAAQTDLDLSHVQAGMYFLTVTNSAGSSTIRIMKQ